MNKNQFIEQDRLSRIDALEEQWRDIPDYIGLYQVSDKGNIRGVDREIKVIGSSQLRKVKGCILNPSKTNKGYLRLSLNKENSKKMFKVHRLVLLAFIGDSDLTCDHLNMVKTDNRLCNLEYVSARENIARASVSKRVTSRFLGVSWEKTKSKWVSKIYYKGKNINLGRFSSKVDASQTYQRALYRINIGLEPRCN